MLSLGYVTVTIFFKIFVVIIIIKVNETLCFILLSLTYDCQDINEILLKVALNTILKQDFVSTKYMYMLGTIDINY